MAFFRLASNAHPVKPIADVCIFVQTSPMKPGIFRFLLLSLLSVALWSCEDPPTQNYQNNLRVSGDMLRAQQYFWDVFMQVDKAARDSTLQFQGKAIIDSAFCIQFLDDAGFSLDYGAEDVLCPDGNLRRGIIIAELYTPYLGDTLEAILRFDAYHINGHRIDAVIRLSGYLEDSTGQKRVNMDVKDARIYIGEDKIIWNESSSLRWVAGMNTPYDIQDDECHLLSGTQFAGTATNLIGFTAGVEEDMRWQRSCPYFVAGRIFLSVPALEFEEGTIVFGDGECDDRVLLWFNGTEIPFFLN